MITFNDCATLMLDEKGLKIIRYALKSQGPKKYQGAYGNCLFVQNLKFLDKRYHSDSPKLSNSLFSDYTHAFNEIKACVRMAHLLLT